MLKTMALALAAGLAGMAWPASAETRAVVVGVSGYPNLPESLRLSGPKNDVAGVAATLVESGVPAENIVVLADGAGSLPAGVLQKGPGTLKNILDAFDRMAAATGPGDLAVFYYSGHGAQQPDADGDEGGGNDEILLPYDTGRWNGSGVEGALADDELRSRMKRILDAGGDFWGIIDACHSATAFRDVPASDAKARLIPAEVLGVPEDMIGSRGQAQSTARLDPGPARGRAALFYAAQEVEVALETTPRGAREDETYGVFTFNLLKRMKANPELSYRRLHQAVVNDIKRSTMMSTQTPELEGTLLDAPVLGRAAANLAADAQWPFYNGTLQAGLLASLSEGAVLGLYADAAAPAGAEVAFGVVEAAGAAKSQVRPAPKPCGEGGACDRAIDEAGYKKARWARLVADGAAPPLVVSKPFRADEGDGRDYTLPLKAFEAALAAPGLGGRVRVSNTGYDVAVVLTDGTLAFAAAPELLDPHGPGTSPRLTLPADKEQAADAIASALDRAARVALLKRLGGAAEAQALGLQADIFLRRAAETARGAACSEDDAAYGDAEQAEGAFHDCDILGVELANRGSKPIDVTVLLVKPDFSIETVWPETGEANRLHIGETKTAEILQMQPDPAAGGEERLVVLATPGLNKAHTVFDGLAQEGLRSGASGLDGELAVEVRPFRVARGPRR
ncbi:MAG TPA: caspase family protein [Mesorhizobium sp.]|jgi:hypothetical protein|nr:caspase family protein [Mesorhizobium sp.]